MPARAPPNELIRDRSEFGERLTKIGTDDLVLIDVEALEQRLQQKAAVIIANPVVDPAGVLHHRERHRDQPSADTQVGGYQPQLCRQMLPPQTQVKQSCADFARRHCTVGSEVQKILLVSIKFAKLASQLIMAKLRRSGDIVQRFGEKTPSRLDEVRREPAPTDELGDALLKDVYWHSRRIAFMPLGASAEEVEVGATISDGAAEHHSVGSASLLAPTTPKRSAKVMLVLSITGATGCAPRVEDGLYSVEQLDVDEGFVTALVLDTLMNDVAEVVAIAQNFGE